MEVHIYDQTSVPKVMVHDFFFDHFQWKKKNEYILSPTKR